MKTAIRCFVSRSRAKGRQSWELNNPEDVPKIEGNDGRDGAGLTALPQSLSPRLRLGGQFCNE